MKTKKIIDTALITIVIAGSAVGFAYVQSNKTIVNASEPAPTASVAPIATTNVHPIDNVKPYEGIPGPNKALLVLDGDYIEQIKKMNESGEWMNEYAIIMNLHWMTHQKIKADRMGNSIKMTPEIIDLMIENIEKAPNIEDRENYLQIAQNWKAGNFSQIRDDHDYFNTLQGGTIGYSNGVNSPEEEDSFVKNNFTVQDFAMETIHVRTGAPAPRTPKDTISTDQYEFMNSIHKAVGIRKKLSEERLEAATEEYLTSMPKEGFKGFTKEELKILAEKELPEGPQTVAEVLAEIEKSYQGEAPFTAQRFAVLSYYLWYGSAGSEMGKHHATFTTGPSPHGPEMQKQIIKSAYETFHQYIDKAIEPLVKRMEAEKAAQ